MASGPQIITSTLACARKPATHADPLPARPSAIAHTRVNHAGLRTGALTLEVVSPHGHPAFSFTAAYDTPKYNRTGGGHHHVGDLTLRVRPVLAGTGAAAGPYRRLSTVVPPQWGVVLPPPFAAK